MSKSRLSLYRRLTVSNVYIVFYCFFMFVDCIKQASSLSRPQNGLFRP